MVRLRMLMVCLLIPLSEWVYLVPRLYGQEKPKVAGKLQVKATIPERPGKRPLPWRISGR
jgi:hypothetical protein